MRKLELSTSITLEEVQNEGKDWVSTSIKEVQKLEFSTSNTLEEVQNEGKDWVSTSNNSDRGKKRETRG